MQTMKRVLAFMLCLCMVLPYMGFTHAHAAGSANATMSVDKTTVEVGDTVTVKITNTLMTVSGFGVYLEFDKDLLECTSVDGYYNEGDGYLGLVKTSGRVKDVEAQVGDNVADTNKDGIFSFGVATGSDTEFEGGIVATLTFTAKAAGTVTFILNEDTSGADSFKGIAATQTLTIKGNEPVCEHENTTAVSNNNGTHNVVCECGEVVSENVPCSGGTATCQKLAECKDCHTAYGNYADHSYGALIPAQAPVHTQDELKAGVDAHYICSVCKKYFTENKTETTLEALTGETPAHTEDPSKTTVTTTPATCTQDGKVVTETFCSCGKCLSHTEKVIAAGSDCVLRDATYTWSADNATCTAEIKCQHGTVHKTETVNTTSKITTVGTCLTAEVVTYTADFSADWTDQTKTVTGGKNANNHVGEQETKYSDNGDDHTVKVYYSECEHEISSTNEPHNYGDDFICDNCGHELAGWVEMDGNWYYVEDGKAATGATRVPYPTVAINGKTYGPNAEDKAYAEAHKDSKYSDAETAVFVFDEKGVFQSDFTGLVGGNRYAVNGVIAWHVGLVEIDGEYYYFAGDENGGGNIMATGKVYAFRNTTNFDMVSGGIYYFGEDGKMCRYEGIVELDGKKCYFENNRLMIGAGLKKLEQGYIYVRSNGQIAIGKYWITKTNDSCNPGMYDFGEDGFMKTAKDPNVNGLVDGIYYKNGMPYYAGLIEIDGDIYYINSAGEAVTGTYYITKIDNYTGSLQFKRGDKLNFGTDGKLIVE